MATFSTFQNHGGSVPMDRLTAKERDVLALMAEGASNDQIAALLEVTARTVETHTSRIFAKLGLEADPTTHRRVLAVLAHLQATRQSAVGWGSRVAAGMTAAWAGGEPTLDLVR